MKNDYCISTFPILMPIASLVDILVLYRNALKRETKGYGWNQPPHELYQLPNDEQGVKLCFS